MFVSASKWLAVFGGCRALQCQDRRPFDSIDRYYGTMLNVSGRSAEMWLGCVQLPGNQDPGQKESRVMPPSWGGGDKGCVGISSLQTLLGREVNGFPNDLEGKPR